MKQFSALFVFFNSILAAFAQFPQPSGGVLFQNQTVARVDILIDADSLAQILNPVNANSDHEYPAIAFFTQNGITDSIGLVGFRLRGNTSRQAQKKSFKVSFNTFVRGARYNGLKGFNLNGEHNDPSLSRAHIAWYLGAQFGLPVSRTAHYELYINGVYRGLYLHIEHINDDWLSLRFKQPSGNLFKCNYGADLNFINNQPNAYKFTASNGVRVYELATNEATDDYSGLSKLIETLNNTASHNLFCALDTIFDIETYLKTLAFEVATGHWDNYAFNKNNYYLYQNPETNKFVYIPYDIDNSFGIDWFNINWATRHINTWPNNQLNLPLAQRLLAVPQMAEIYRFYLREFGSFLSDTSLQVYMQQLHQRIAPFVYADNFRTLDYNFTNTDFDQSFNRTTAFLHVKMGINPFITQRHAANLQQLGSFNAAPIIHDLNLELTTIANQLLVSARVVDDNLQSVVCRYTPANGTLQILPLYDDGLHGDGAANDGIFANFITQFTASSLTFQIVATDASNRIRTKPCNPRFFKFPSNKLLVINEFMAENTSTIADNLGVFSDWIEIFNNSADSVFLGDLYLTDKRNDPFLWPMPHVYIPPFGFKLFWASNNVAAGPNHTNFALSRQGEQIGLFRRVGTVADTIDYIQFGAQVANISFGRAFDASPVWVSFANPTPGASNNASVGVNTPSKEAVLVFPNPYNQFLKLQNTSKHNWHFELYNVLGQQVNQGVIAAESAIEIADGDAPGIRILRLNADNQIKLYKLIKLGSQ